jgi:nondiscriminating aspartyl-tRNA synthetase
MLSKVYHRLHRGGDSPLPFRLGKAFSTNNVAERREQLREQKLHEEKEHQILKIKRQDDIDKRRAAEDERAAREEPAEQQARYGNLGLLEFPKNDEPTIEISDLTEKDVGSTVYFRARVHTKRKLSSSLAFFVFRQREISIQGVFQEQPDVVSGHMVQWAERITPESIVLVRGTVQTPVEPVTGATQHNIEVMITDLYVLAEAEEPLPFKVYDFETTEQKGIDHQITDRVLFSNPVLHHRIPSSRAIFRIQSGICTLFRTFLSERGFMEIHTPKLQGGATESGSSVFKVDFFGRDAFLAQSPQLMKQMCIASDFDRVFEIGPVFRAENSNTHRHLVEFTGLDLEMALKTDYHEALDLIDELLKHIFKGVYEQYSKELETLEVRFEHQKLVWLEQTPRLKFQEAVRMLNESGWKTPEGEKLSEEEDLDTRSEIRLGELVKEKYHTDYYIIDKFPADARPFYTMLDKNDHKYTNSFDIFVRGQEILTGGQRIHLADELKKQIEAAGFRPEDMEEYIAAFEAGCPPHAGAGIGLERILFLLLNLGNIRHASLAPRDPKSFPIKDHGFRLRYPEASTLETVLETDLPPLEKLIANYGDAANTSWLDDRYTIWRDNMTGAAIGYVMVNSYAIILGDPLCDRSQLSRVIHKFLRALSKDLKLDPLWLLISPDTEEILANRFGWHTLTCTAEQRLDPKKPKDLAKKVRHAENSGVSTTAIPYNKPVDDDVVLEINERVKEWLGNRKGRQVHISQIDPWKDMEHRRYIYSRDKSGKICALVVLTELSLDHGYQIKWSLDFAGAPSGAIEMTTIKALEVASEAGAKSVTYGTSATAHLTAENNLNGIAVKSMSKLYESIVHRLKLTQKTEFREKIGAIEDPVYIAWPRMGFGPRALKALFDFLESDK